ncbi:MAG TPA: DUF4230 domain-containing protein [Candidatus Acidoferrum sp.]|jgi:hypothetical protein
MSLTTEPVFLEPLPPLPELPPPRRSTGAWILGILLGATLAVILIGAFVWMTTGLGLLHVLTTLREGSKTTTQINVDQPTVVRQIQQLQRLETVNYSLDKIISGERSNPYFPKFLVGDRLLLVMHGQVVAGIDLAGVHPEDVTVAGDKVSITLPPAEVFTTSLDNSKTRVYSRETGLLSSTDPFLESEVRQEAERQLTEAALQDGILAMASQNGKTTIAGLLRGIGFHDVSVQ